MLYNNFEDLKISALGMGGMRFPVNEDQEVDMNKTREIIDLCIKNGINYFDTAWFYHKGKSEEILGELLSRYPRESYFLADKMPGYEVTSRENVEKVFNEQLRKTRSEYFDFYLLHNVCEDSVDKFTDEEIGLIPFFEEMKKKGRIRHFGCSIHAKLPLFKEFIENYHSKLEFCQIQLNWLDWSLQEAKEKVEILNKYNIPIWVMEPVRGGRLANLSEKDTKAMYELRPDESVPAWAFRFLQGIDGIKVILSGMSAIEQVEDNIKTFSESKPLNATELKLVFDIADGIVSKRTLNCTQCKYCVEECVNDLDIPKLLSLYNQMCLINECVDISKVRGEAGENLPDKCIACRKCEKKCPQGIEISAILADFREKLGL